jgi:hypothetical protein
MLKTLWPSVKKRLAARCSPALLRSWRVVARRVTSDGHNDDSGTAITEFALAFGMYVLIVMGTIQIAIWAFSSSITQFAVWEGCRAGAAAYQPPPPDGRNVGGLGDQQTVDDSEWVAAAEASAIARTDALLDWLPITSNHGDIEVVIEEADVGPGEAGRREIQVTVGVRPLVLFPMTEQFLGVLGSGGFVLDRACRLHLSRYYSY